MNHQSECPCTSLMARGVLDPARGHEARGLQSVRQIRLSLLRLVAHTADQHSVFHLGLMALG